jgi:hypothetical protein
MYEVISAAEYGKFLSLAPTEVLKDVGVKLVGKAQELPDGSVELQRISTMYSMLMNEYYFRSVESDTRRLERFLTRSLRWMKGISKVIASIDAGAVAEVVADR